MSTAWSRLTAIFKLRPRLWAGEQARDDVLQDTFLRHLTEPEAPVRWVVHNAARHENRQHAARQQRLAPLEDDDITDDHTDQHELLSRAEIGVLLDHIVDALPPVDRQLYLLLARQQLTVRAAAARLGQSRSWTHDNYQRVASRVETLLRIHVGEALRRSAP